MPVRTSSPVAEDHFHAAVGVEVVAEIRARVAGAAIERVADQRCPNRDRAVDPELELALAMWR